MLKVSIYRSIFTLHLIIIGLCCSFNTTGQQYQTLKFDRLFSENVQYVKGLSQNWIYNIHQDRYGYMWFGTWEGLNKYDGYDFTIYSMEDGLSDHVIYCMLEDDEGIFWIGTDKGFNKFDRKTQKFTQ